jgi:hypothetical protein
LGICSLSCAGTARNRLEDAAVAGTAAAEVMPALALTPAPVVEVLAICGCGCDCCCPLGSKGQGLTGKRTPGEILAGEGRAGEFAAGRGLGWLAVLDADGDNLRIPSGRIGFAGSNLDVRRSGLACCVALRL